MRIRSIFIFCFGITSLNQASAQVSTASLFNIQNVENPAALSLASSKTSLSVQSLNGSGNFNQGLLEREKYTLTQTSGLLTHQNNNYSLQLLMMPKQTVAIDEITQYRRASATSEEVEALLSFAKKYSDNLVWGMGYQNIKNTIDSYATTTHKLKAGMTLEIPFDLVAGLGVNIVNSSAPADQARSWVEQQLGIGWIYKGSNSQARIDASLTRSPKVYQKPSKDIGGNYQREWLQNRIVLEGSMGFSFVELALGVDYRSRKYSALEVGQDETEAEQNLYAGLLFIDQTIGVFAGQSKVTNKINAHLTTYNINRVSVGLSF